MSGPKSASESAIDDEPLAAAYNRALALEKAGRFDAAAAAYAEVLRLDPDDHGGAAVRLAAIGRGPTPERAPVAYVMSLFDQHAEVFDAILVGKLGYDVPAILGKALAGGRPDRFSRMLDLGCGTGLAGKVMRDRVDYLTGVEIAPLMIEMASERAVYDALYVGEIIDFLQNPPDDLDHDPAWDLVVATDVVPYFGDLAPLVTSVASRLYAGGVFGFSTECLDENALAGRPYMVGPSQRFAHDPAYVLAVLDSAGFTKIRTAPITVRHEDGKPVTGHLVLAVAAGSPGSEA